MEQKLVTRSKSPSPSRVQTPTSASVTPRPKQSAEVIRAKELERMKKVVYHRSQMAAIKIQKVARGYLVRRDVVPKLTSTQLDREIERMKNQLSRSLQDMKVHVHHISRTIGKDFDASALRIQKWVRGCLARIRVSTLRYEIQRQAEYRWISSLVIDIQRVWRGSVDRKYVRSLLSQRDSTRKKRENEIYQRTNSAATKIQSLWRTVIGKQKANKRREELRLMALWEETNKKLQIRESLLSTKDVKAKLVQNHKFKSGTEGSNHASNSIINLRRNSDNRTNLIYDAVNDRWMRRGGGGYYEEPVAHIDKLKITGHGVNGSLPPNGRSHSGSSTPVFRASRPSSSTSQYASFSMVQQQHGKRVEASSPALSTPLGFISNANATTNVVRPHSAASATSSSPSLRNFSSSNRESPLLVVAQGAPSRGEPLRAALSELRDHISNLEKERNDHSGSPFPTVPFNARPLSAALSRASTPSHLWLEEDVFDMSISENVPYFVRSLQATSAVRDAKLALLSDRQRLREHGKPSAQDAIEGVDFIDEDEERKRQLEAERESWHLRQAVSTDLFERARRVQLYRHTTGIGSTNKHFTLEDIKMKPLDNHGSSPSSTRRLKGLTNENGFASPRANQRAQPRVAKPAADASPRKTIDILSHRMA
eukprot:GILK01005099.1.p1 GENE.GILK01005099.1~~GILK01005099.1.p1  ORF type:complete len:751 (+),score=98.05 GILK01005099.1:299-2254(+)